MYTFKVIKLDDLMLSDTSKVISVELVEKLANSIEKLGFRNPIQVYELPRLGLFWFLKARKYQIIDGHARYSALRLLRRYNADCIVVPKESVKLYLQEKSQPNLRLG